MQVRDLFVKEGCVFWVTWVTLVTKTIHTSLTKTRSRTYTTPSPTPHIKQPTYCLYNYLIRVHVQPDDGQHQRLKHVVVHDVVNT